MTTTVPRPGLGTSGNTDESTCIETIATALDLGYRHIDTAQMYDNESYVGTGISQSSVDREEIFLATKVHPDNLGPATVRSSVEASLDRLDTTYIDLLYVHWPRGDYNPEATLPAFDTLVADGYVKHVGVSNFTPDLLTEAQSILETPITAHQVERHPLLPQDTLLDRAREDDHALVAYAPLLKARFDLVPELADIAAHQDVPPAQVCLAWQLSTDRLVPIPKATGDHIHENWVAQDLSLPASALEIIDSIDRRHRLVNPSDAAWNR